MKAIEEAEANLLEALENGREVPPRDLRKQILEASRTAKKSLGEGQVSLAYWRLLNCGDIELTDQLTVRLPQPALAA